MNESIFERCEHDRENPYVMISREMAQDKSISPKAKGVLLYLLSLPKNWRIYHSQLQDGLGVGEDYINSAMDELIANGYADRTRERVKGIFQPYKYKIREFKKFNPNGKNQPGLTGPVNPGLQNRDKESRYIKNKQQQAASAAAAVPPKKESRKAKRLVVYDCLKEVDILAKEKDWLTSHYDEQVVKEAIAWATSPYITITTTLTQAIKWACKERPETPKEKLSVYEAIKQVFSHGEFYNGALCDLNETGISFDRGMKHEQLSFDKSFSWAKFEALCRSFGIVDLVRR